MKAYILLVLLLIANFLLAQEVDYNKIIYPDTIEPPSFEEKLVQIAWRNTPMNRTFESEVFIAKKALREAQLSWTENLSASFNLNEGNINPGDNVNLFFPRYNFGLSLSLGTFVSTPLKSKQARGGLDIAEDELKQRKLELRAETLRRYQYYLTQIELLNLKTDAADNFWTNHLMVEENYQNGRASLMEYNQSLYAYNKAKEEKILAENDLYQARIALEELIGVPLNSIR